MGDHIVKFDPEEDAFDFMRAIGLEQEIDPEPVIEERVAPRPLSHEDFTVYDPFAEGPLASKAEFELRIVRRLLRGPPFALTDPMLEEMRGLKLFGVYALFYQGTHELYAKLLSPASQNPVYAGSNKKAALRINGHRKSISKSDLKPVDFTVRFLILDETLYRAVELVIHEMFHPVWIYELTGFGTPGTGSADLNKKRAERQNRSEWDSMHNLTRIAGADTGNTKWELARKVERGIPKCLRAYHQAMKLLAV